MVWCRYWLAIVLSLSFGPWAIAEVSAVIDGPTEGRTGDLVVLSGEQSVGDGYRWIPPPGLQTLECQGAARQIAFASGRSGQFTFTLVLADTEANIAYATHTVAISSSGEQPAPGPDPDPGPEPDPEPEPGNYEGIRRLSMESAEALADRATAQSLSAAIRAADEAMEQLCRTGQCPGLAAAKQMMVAAIERSLLLRAGNSRRVNWLDGWRRPLNEALGQLPLDTVPAYRAAMRAAALGLSQAG